MMNFDNAYRLSNVAQYIHGLNDQLSDAMTQVGGRVQKQLPVDANPGRVKKWAGRAATTAALAALPSVLLAPPLAVGPIALLLCGTGSRPSRDPSSNSFLRGLDFLGSHGLLGIPERLAVFVGKQAEARQMTTLHGVAMSIAIGISLVAQLGRIPASVAATALTVVHGLSSSLTVLCNEGVRMAWNGMTQVGKSKRNV